MEEKQIIFTSEILTQARKEAENNLKTYDEEKLIEKHASREKNGNSKEKS
jgi:hypothetical protein